MKEYHEHSLQAFQAYKQFYTEQVVPLLTEQKDVEAALLGIEPKAAMDAEVCLLPFICDLYPFQIAQKCLCAVSRDAVICSCANHLHCVLHRYIAKIVLWNGVLCDTHSPSWLIFCRDIVTVL